MLIALRAGLPFSAFRTHTLARKRITLVLDFRPKLETRPQGPVRLAGRYLLNSFFFAAASSLSLSSPTLGYARSSEARVSMTADATTTRVNHLLSAGTTYHGASFVAVS